MRIVAQCCVKAARQAMRAITAGSPVMAAVLAVSGLGTVGLHPALGYQHAAHTAAASPLERGVHVLHADSLDNTDDSSATTKDTLAPQGGLNDGVTGRNTGTSADAVEADTTAVMSDGSGLTDRADSLGVAPVSDTIRTAIPVKTAEQYRIEEERKRHREQYQEEERSGLAPKEAAQPERGIERAVTEEAVERVEPDKGDAAVKDREDRARPSMLRGAGPQRQQEQHDEEARKRREKRAEEVEREERHP